LDPNAEGSSKVFTALLLTEMVRKGEVALADPVARDFLTIQLPVSWGLPKLRLRPEGLGDFFVAELPLRLTFQAASDGRVNGLLVHPPRGQQAIHAKRIGSD